MAFHRIIFIPDIFSCPQLDREAVPCVLFAAFVMTIWRLNQLKFHVATHVNLNELETTSDKSYRRNVLPIFAKYSHKKTVK